MKILLVVLVSLIFFCNCSYIQNSKICTVYYQYGAVYFESNNDVILNIFENNKHMQYKLIFNGKKLIKKFIKEISFTEYTLSYKKWYQQLLKSTENCKYPPRDYIEVTSKRFDNIEIDQFSKLEKRQALYLCNNKLEIKTKNNVRNIFIEESTIIDFTVLKNKDKNYLLILQGETGSGSFSSIVDIYKL